MSFGAAIGLLKAGAKVRRRGWVVGRYLDFGNGVVWEHDKEGLVRAEMLLSSEDVMALDWTEVDRNLEEMFQEGVAGR